MQRLDTADFTVHSLHWKNDHVILGVTNPQFSGMIYFTQSSGYQNRPEILTGRAPGYNNGPIKQAQFSIPISICQGLNETLEVADMGNHVIRAIHASGVTTVIGTGKPGNRDGYAGVAELDLPVMISGSSTHILIVEQNRTSSMRIYDRKTGIMRTWSANEEILRIFPLRSTNGVEDHGIVFQKGIHRVKIDKSGEIDASTVHFALPGGFKDAQANISSNRPLITFVTSTGNAAKVYDVEDASVYTLDTIDSATSVFVASNDAGKFAIAKNFSSVNCSVAIHDKEPEMFRNDTKVPSKTNSLHTSHWMDVLKAENRVQEEIIPYGAIPPLSSQVGHSSPSSNASHSNASSSNFISSPIPTHTATHQDIQCGTTPPPPFLPISTLNSSRSFDFNPTSGSMTSLPSSTFGSTPPGTFSFPGVVSPPLRQSFDSPSQSRTQSNAFGSSAAGFGPIHGNNSLHSPSSSSSPSLNPVSLQSPSPQLVESFSRGFSFDPDVSKPPHAQMPQNPRPF